jgi:hypothetical protein
MGSTGAIGASQPTKPHQQLERITSLLKKSPKKFKNIDRKNGQTQTRTGVSRCSQPQTRGLAEGEFGSYPKPVDN